MIIHKSVFIKIHKKGKKDEKKNLSHDDGSTDVFK